MSGSRRTTSKSKLAEQPELVETPKIRSLPSNVQDKTQPNDIATQLYKLELKNKAAMRTSTEVRNAT
jgi:hypothetical protein